VDPYQPECTPPGFKKKKEWTAGERIKKLVQYGHRAERGVGGEMMCATNGGGANGTRHAQGTKRLRKKSILLGNAGKTRAPK